MSQRQIGLADRCLKVIKKVIKNNKKIYYIFQSKYIMYKNDELLDNSYKATCKEQKLLDTIDASFYNYLYKINKLFKEKKYKSKIGLKSSPDSVNQILIYLNPINGTERFTLQIHNKYSISVRLPLKNCNYLYSTSFFDIEETYNFLKIHI